MVIWIECCRHGQVGEQDDETDRDAQGWTMECTVNPLREFEIIPESVSWCG